MLGWPVADVVAFFESQDAAALRNSLVANSVQGKDLLRFTVAPLQTYLTFNVFTAENKGDLRAECVS